jgi:ABC-type nitrate/sulfonate/bicarbonate transport system substrate-binding protein
MRKYKALRSFLAGVLLVALVASTGEAQQLPAFELGLPEDGITGLVGQYVIEKQIDKKHGFVLKPRWAGLVEVERILALGKIPTGLTTPEASLRANLQGIPLQIVMVTFMAHQQILVRKESPYQAIQDLRGKPIALTGELSGLYNMFDFIMKSQGVDIEREFRLRKLAAPVIVAALEKGDVEAGIIWEAHVSRLLATGKYRVLAKLGDEMTRILNTRVKVIGYIGALEPWIQANPDLVAKLRAAWLEAIRRTRDDEGYFRQNAKKFFGLEKPEEVSLGWRRAQSFMFPSDFKWPDVESIRAEEAYLSRGTEMGMFPKEAAKIVQKIYVR